MDKVFGIAVTALDPTPIPTSVRPTLALQWPNIRIGIRPTSPDAILIGHPSYLYVTTFLPPHLTIFSLSSSTVGG